MTLSISERESYLNFLLPSEAATTTNPNNEIDTDNAHYDGIFVKIIDGIGLCAYLPRNNITNLSVPLNSLSIMHLNIPFLHANFDELHYPLNSFSQPPRIICLTESRITHQLIPLSIPGYSFEFIKPTGLARGCAIYVSNHLKIDPKIQQYQLCNSDSMWFNVIESNTKYVIGVMYRHLTLSDILEFLKDLELCLNDFTNKNIQFYIMGDLNINISATN